MPVVFQPSLGAADIEMNERPMKTCAPSTAQPLSENENIEREAIDSTPFLQAFEDSDIDQADDELLIKKDYKNTSRLQALWQNYRAEWPKLTAICLASVLGIILRALLVPKSRTQNRRPEPKIGPFWPGFSKVENYFAFGDSWTTTFFDPKLAQPSVENPIGNPTFPGDTSSLGPNYFGYLATKYNHSFIRAYDFAFGGSVIDADIDHPMLDWLDFSHQLKDSFIKYYTTNLTGVPIPVSWKPENTLFSTFFGINDVIVFNRTYPQLDRLFATYESLIGKLYDASARNFLIINVPPVDRSPGSLALRPEHRVALAADVDLFNRRINDLTLHIARKYENVTIFEFDVHQLFKKVLNDPQSVHETKSFRNITACCKAYKNELVTGMAPTREQVDSCGGLDVANYMWKDELHVTWPMHDAMAAGIEKLLLGKDSI